MFAIQAKILRLQCTGDCFNLRMSSYQFRNSHYKDLTVSRTSYFLNTNPKTCKDIQLHVACACVCVSVCTWHGRPHFPSRISLGGDTRFDFTSVSVALNLRKHKTYLHCPSFLSTMMALVETLPRWRQGPICFALSISWLLMDRRPQGVRASTAMRMV